MSSRKLKPTVGCNLVMLRIFSLDLSAFANLGGDAPVALNSFGCRGAGGRGQIPRPRHRSYDNRGALFDFLPEPATIRNIRKNELALVKSELLRVFILAKR